MSPLSRRSLLRSAVTLLAGSILPLPLVAFASEPEAKPEMVKLVPGNLTASYLLNAYAQVEAHETRVEALYVNPKVRNTLIKLENHAFDLESRYNARTQKCWYPGKDMNGSPGSCICAAIFYSEGKHVMGYLYGALVIADPVLAENQIRLRSERKALMEEYPYYKPEPVKWIELSSEGLTEKSAIRSYNHTEEEIGYVYKNETVVFRYYNDGKWRCV